MDFGNDNGNNNTSLMLLSQEVGIIVFKLYDKFELFDDPFSAVDCFLIYW